MQRGVQVSMVTNSLAWHDAAAVNSHCKKWRKPANSITRDGFAPRHGAAQRAAHLLTDCGLADARDALAGQLRSRRMAAKYVAKSSRACSGRMWPTY